MPSPTDAPASLPERLADAEGELPRSVNAAILAECDSPRICSVNGRVKEGIRCGPCEIKALFTILARLTAAESAREAAFTLLDDCRNDCLRLHREKMDRLDRAIAAEAALSVALARAERAEKALDFYRSAAVTSATMEGLIYRGVSNSMFRHAWEADRAALVHGVTAEET